MRRSVVAHSLASAILVAVGLVIRFQISETRELQNLKESKECIKDGSPRCTDPLPA